MTTPVTAAATEIRIREVTLADWGDLCTLHSSLQESKAAGVITATLPELEIALCKSRLFPGNTGFLGAWWRDRIVGMVSLMLVDNPVLGDAERPFVRQCFVHSVYISSTATRDYGNGRTTWQVPPEVGKNLLLGMEEWAAKRGAVYMYGNVRLDGNFDGFERKYGFTRTMTIVGKPVIPRVEAV